MGRRKTHGRAVWMSSSELQKEHGRNVTPSVLGRHHKLRYPADASACITNRGVHQDIRSHILGVGVTCRRTPMWSRKPVRPARRRRSIETHSRLLDQAAPRT